MTTSLGESSHLERIVRLRGDGYVWNTEEKYQGIDTPDLYSAQAHRDLWKNAGHRANEVADALQTALDGLLEGWKGKGARAFEKKVRQVIYFAGMIAHHCDSTHTAPTKPEGYDDESEGGGGGGPEGPEAPTGSGGAEEKAFFQVWEEICEQLEHSKDEEKNPGFPWTLSGNNYFMEADGDGFANLAGLEYRVKNNDEDIWGDEAEEDVWEKYKECFGGSSVDSLASAGKLTREEGDGTWVFFWPKGNSNMEKFYIHVKLNETENTTSKEFVQGLMEKYGQWPEQEPQPIQPPKLFSDAGDGNGGAGGGGGGGMPGGGMPGGGMPGGGGTPGGPSGPESPEMPDRPDMDPDTPDVPNPDDPEVPNPDDPEVPDPELPDQPDSPDTSDPNWPGPGDSGPGGPGDPRVPGGPNGPGNENTGWPGRDIGTETARTGGGGPGTISGGGPGTGTIGGSSPGGGAPGGSGAGVAPGVAGGPGAAGAGPGSMGAGGGRGAGGGMGMMPMMGGGMGAGAGEGGNDGDRDTWLNEDEDVWGTDGDAPPPVLGGGL